MTSSLALQRKRRSFLTQLLCGGVALATAAGSGHAQESVLRLSGQIPPEVDTIYERGLTWLKGAQTQEGGWKGSYEGAGVDGICLMAFLASGEDPNYGRHATTVRRAVRAIITQQDEKTGYLPSSMYHHGFGMLALAEAYGAVDESLLWEGGKKVRSIGAALELAIRLATTSQKNNRWGGWRYAP